jgi:hypothetical protein
LYRRCVKWIVFGILIYTAVDIGIGWALLELVCFVCGGLLASKLLVLTETPQAVSQALDSYGLRAHWVPHLGPRPYLLLNVDGDPTWAIEAIHRTNTGRVMGLWRETDHG